MTFIRNPHNADELIASCRPKTFLPLHTSSLHHGIQNSV